MHTENLEASQLIRAAVVAQLAKPAVEPSAVALLTKGFRYELLTWVGIVGGALTLFGNLDAALKLADWARVLVQDWREWTHAFWLWAFGWLGIHLPPELTPLLSFLLFGSLLTIGQAVKFKNTIHNRLVDKYQGKSFQLISLQPMLAVFGMFAATFSLISIYRYFIINPPAYLGYITSVGVYIIPVGMIVLFARHRFHAAISAGLMLTFFLIIAIAPLHDLLHDLDHPSDVMGGWGLVALGVSVWILPLILLSVAPAKAISRRLIFLAIGLLLLIVLNELSKLGLDVTAPKLQG
jgi:hypothetical protein